MKRFFIFSFIFLSVFKLKAQNEDNEKILNAKHAIDVFHKCDVAINMLASVSDQGKNTEQYFMALAKAYDCKNDQVSSLYYYQKCIEINPSNSEANEKVTAINNQIEREKVAEQQRMINEENERQQSIAHEEMLKKNEEIGREREHEEEGKRQERRAYERRHRNDVRIKDGYFAFGFGYKKFTDDSFCVANESVGGFFKVAFPILNRHVLFDIGFSAYFGLQTNTIWIAKAYNTQIDNFANYGSGGSTESLCICPSIILVNANKFAWTLGPEIGASLANFPSVSMKNSTDDFEYQQMPEIFGFYGVQTSFYFSKTFFLKFEYIKGFPTQISTTDNGNTINTVNFSYTHFDAAFGFKFSN